jgi:large subunit ribosomal protein L15
MNLDGACASGRPRKGRKRVGRGPGSGHGKMSCRGMNGCKSRSGYSRKLTKEGGQTPLFRRLPKRGFSNDRHRVEYQPVNVGDLSVFEAGSVVGPQELWERGIARRKVLVKILGAGEPAKSLRVQAHEFSKSAEEKIRAAGGSVEIISVRDIPGRPAHLRAPAAEEATTTAGA